LDDEADPVKRMSFAGSTREEEEEEPGGGGALEVPPVKERLDELPMTEKPDYRGGERRKKRRLRPEKICERRRERWSDWLGA